MTRPFNKEQFLKFVDSLYAEKHKSRSVSEDAAGYFVKIENDITIPGRYSLMITGPTGKTDFRYMIAAMGIPKVAADLYDKVTEDIEEVPWNNPFPNPQDYFQSDHWKAEVEYERRDIEAEQRAHDDYMNGERRNEDEKQHMPED